MPDAQVVGLKPLTCPFAPHFAAEPLSLGATLKLSEELPEGHPAKPRGHLLTGHEHITNKAFGRHVEEQEDVQIEV
uniref:Uncharacterized protein n=1 Tax=Knipowitschia caucasica TaxID=637954 RepID=A0AAV2LY15_KNICA